MTWQEACQVSEEQAAFRFYSCQCVPHCSGVSFIRHRNGNAERLHRGCFDRASLRAQYQRAKKRGEG